jgi:hypothetical protein
MANQSSKLWTQVALAQIAVARASQMIQQTGRALPCRVVAVSGSFVTVAFEINDAEGQLPQITIPKAESPWIRVPTQVGDYGVTFGADAYLGGINGTNGGTANLAQPSNLSSLLFLPCASQAFSSVNTNAAYIAGPQGVVIQTEDGKTSIVVNESGITLTFNSQTITFNSSGLTSAVAVQVNSTVTASGTIDSTGGDVKAGSISLTNHVHTGVQSGSSNTGPATG